MQVARNVTMERGASYPPASISSTTRREILPCLSTHHRYGRVTRCRCRASPNLNAYAERWVRSVKEECLARMILFGKRRFAMH